MWFSPVEAAQDLIISKGPVILSWIPHGYRPRFHIWELTRMRIYRSATDPLQNSYGGLRWPKDRFPDGHLTVFLIRKAFPCQSVADPVRSGYVLGDIYWHGSLMDEKDTTKTSRMGIQTIRTLTDELRVRYGRTTDTVSVRTSRTNQACLIFFRNGPGILPDFKHATTDHSMLLRVSQGHYGWKIWSINHSTFSKLGNLPRSGGTSGHV